MRNRMNREGLIKRRQHTVKRTSTQSNRDPDQQPSNNSESNSMDFVRNLSEFEVPDAPVATDAMSILQIKDEITDD